MRRDQRQIPAEIETLKQMLRAVIEAEDISDISEDEDCVITSEEAADCYIVD